MDRYKIAVVLKERSTTDTAGTLVFGEELPDGWGRILNVVTAEHDSLPIDDGDAELIDKTKNTMLDHLHERYKTIPELGQDSEFYDPSIIIVKKGNGTYSDEDIEIMVKTIEANKAKMQPSVTISTYNGVDRIHGQYMGDEYVYFSIKESEWNGSEAKHLNLEEKLYKLINEILTYEVGLTDKLLKIVNKFWACGCHPTLANWHKTNLSQINHDDVFIRLFGKLATILYKTDNTIELVETLTGDIADKFFKKNINIPEGSGDWVDVKITSNFNFPRIRGVIIGFDGSSVNVARFDCTARSGAPLYVTVDLFSNINFETSCIVAPADGDTTLTLDARFNYVLITDVPKVRYKIEPSHRFLLNKKLPLSNAYFGDNIQNNSKTLIHNQTDTKMVTQEMSIVGELIKDYLPAYATEFRAEHYVPHNINGIDDEYLKIYANVSNILDHQDLEFTFIDNVDPDAAADVIVMPYKAFKTLPDGLNYKYKKIYDAGVHYTIKLRFIKPDGSKVERTKVYTINTMVFKTPNPKVMLDIFRTRKDRLRLINEYNNPYPEGTLLKIRLTNGDALNTNILDEMYVVTAEDEANGYAEIELPVNIVGEAQAIITAKAPHHFDSIETKINMDMDLILPLSDFEVNVFGINLDNDVLIDKDKYNALYQMSPENTFKNVFDIPSWIPNDWSIDIETGAPTIDVKLELEGTDIVYSRAIRQSALDIKYRRKRKHKIHMFRDVEAILYKWYSTLYKGNFSADSINKFYSIANNTCVPIIPNKKYKITITTKDFDDSIMKSVVTELDGAIYTDTSKRALYTNDILHAHDTEELFDYFNSPVTTTITGIQNLDTVLMYLDDDTDPAPDKVRMYRFKINQENKLVFNESSQYDTVITADDKFMLYTADYLSEIMTKEQLSFAYNTTSLLPDRVDITKSRTKFKTPQITSLTINPVIDNVINFVNDEYVNIEVGYAFVKKDNFEVEFKIVETVTSDNGEVKVFTKTVTLDENELASLNNILRYDINQVPNTRDVKIDVTATLNLVSGEDFTSDNRSMTVSKIIPATKVPFFKHSQSQDVINTIDLDIRKEENVSYVAGSSIYVKIEVENKRGEYDDKLVFEDSFIVGVFDERQGFFRVPIIGNQVTRGVYVVTVVAKEPNKLDSYKFVKTFDFRVKTYKSYSINVNVSSNTINFTKLENEKFTNSDIVLISSYVPRRHFISKYSARFWTNVSGEEKTLEYSDLKTFELDTEWDYVEITAILEKYPEVWHDITVVGTFRPSPYMAEHPTDNSTTEYRETVRVLKDDDFFSSMLLNVPELYKLEPFEILRVNENRTINIELKPKDFIIVNVVFPNINYEDYDINDLAENLVLNKTFNQNTSTITYVYQKGSAGFAPFMEMPTNYRLFNMERVHKDITTSLQASSDDYNTVIVNDLKNVSEFMVFDDIIDMSDLDKYKNYTYTYNLGIRLDNTVYIKFEIKNRDMLKFDPSVAHLNSVPEANISHECYINYEGDDISQILTKLPRVIDADEYPDTKYKWFTYARVGKTDLVTDTETNLTGPTVDPTQFTQDILNAYLSGFQENEINPNVTVKIYGNLDLSDRSLNLGLADDLGVSLSYKPEILSHANVTKNGDDLILQGDLSWLDSDDINDYEFLNKYLSHSGDFIQSTSGFLKDWNKSLYKLKGFVLTSDSGVTTIITKDSTSRHIMDKLTATRDTGVTRFDVKPYIYVDEYVSLNYIPSYIGGNDPEDSHVAKSRMYFSHPRLGIWQDNIPFDGGQLRRNDEVCEYKASAADFMSNLANMIPRTVFRDPYETKIWYAQVGNTTIECPLDDNYNQNVDAFITNLAVAIKREVTQNGVSNINIYGKVLKDALRAVRFVLDVEDSTNTEIYEVIDGQAVKLEKKSITTYLRFRMPMNEFNFVNGSRYFFTGDFDGRVNGITCDISVNRGGTPDTTEKLPNGSWTKKSVILGTNIIGNTLNYADLGEWVYDRYFNTPGEIIVTIRPQRFFKARVYGTDNYLENQNSSLDYYGMKEFNVPFGVTPFRLDVAMRDLYHDIESFSNANYEVCTINNLAPNLENYLLSHQYYKYFHIFKDSVIPKWKPGIEALDTHPNSHIDFIITHFTRIHPLCTRIYGDHITFDITKVGPAPAFVKKRYIYINANLLKPEFKLTFEPSWTIWIDLDEAMNKVVDINTLKHVAGIYVEFKPSGIKDISIFDMLGTTDRTVMGVRNGEHYSILYAVEHLGYNSYNWQDDLYVLNYKLKINTNDQLSIHIYTKKYLKYSARDYVAIYGTVEVEHIGTVVRPCIHYEREFNSKRGLAYHFPHKYDITPNQRLSIYRELIHRYEYKEILEFLKLIDKDRQLTLGYIPFPPFIPKNIDIVIFHRDKTNKTWLDDKPWDRITMIPKRSEHYYGSSYDILYDKHNEMTTNFETIGISKKFSDITGYFVNRLKNYEYRNMTCLTVDGLVYNEAPAIRLRLFSTDIGYGYSDIVDYIGGYLMCVHNAKTKAGVFGVFDAIDKLSHKLQHCRLIDETAFRDLEENPNKSMDEMRRESLNRILKQDVDEVLNSYNDYGQEKYFNGPEITQYFLENTHSYSRYRSLPIQWSILNNSLTYLALNEHRNIYALHLEVDEIYSNQGIHLHVPNATMLGSSPKMSHKDTYIKLAVNPYIGNLVYNLTSNALKTVKDVTPSSPNPNEPYSAKEYSVLGVDGELAPNIFKLKDLEIIKPNYIIHGGVTKTFQNPLRYTPSQNSTYGLNIDNALWYSKYFADGGPAGNNDKHDGHLFELVNFVNFDKFALTNSGTGVDFTKLMSAFSMPNAIHIPQKYMQRKENIASDIPRDSRNITLTATVVDRFVPSTIEGYGHRNPPHFWYSARYNNNANIQILNFTNTEPITIQEIKDTHTPTWNINNSNKIIMIRKSTDDHDIEWKLHEHIEANLKTDPSLKHYKDEILNAPGNNIYEKVDNLYKPYGLHKVVEVLNTICPKFQAILRTDVIELNPTAEEIEKYLQIKPGSVSSHDYVYRWAKPQKFSECFRINNSTLTSTHLTTLWLQFAVIDNFVYPVYMNVNKSLLDSEDDVIVGHALPYIENTSTSHSWKYVCFRVMDLETYPSDDTAGVFELYTRKYLKPNNIDTSFKLANTDLDPWSLVYRHGINYGYDRPFGYDDRYNYNVTTTKIDVSLTDFPVHGDDGLEFFTKVNSVSVNGEKHEAGPNKSVFGVNTGRLIRNRIEDFKEYNTGDKDSSNRYADYIIDLVNDASVVPSTKDLVRTIMFDKDYGNGYVFREVTTKHRHIPINAKIDFASPVNSVSEAIDIIAANKTPFTQTNEAASSYASYVIRGIPSLMFNDFIFTKKGFNIDYNALTSFLVNPIDLKYLQNVGLYTINLINMHPIINANLDNPNILESGELMRSLTGFPKSLIENVGLSDTQSNLKVLTTEHSLSKVLTTYYKYVQSRLKVNPSIKSMYTKSKSTPSTGGVPIFRAVALIAGQNDTDVPDYIVHPSNDVITDDEFNTSQEIDPIDQNLKPDLDELINPCAQSLDVLAVYKNGLDVKILVRSQAWYKIYSVVDFTRLSYITIITPNADLEKEYVVELKYTLPTEDSNIKLGSYFVDFDLSRPINVNLTHMPDYDVIKSNYTDIKEAIPEGFYKLGSDPNFKLGKKPIPSGLYLKVNSVYTDINSANETTNVALYYPMFRHRDFVGVKGLDVYHNGALYHVRATASKEVYLPNGAVFIPNEHLEFTTTILDTKVNSKILRLY